MISIVCSYTDKKILKKMLVNSLKTQSYKQYETVFLNSKKLGFKSASEALTYGFKKAKGEIIVFTHQDIELKSCNVLEKIHNYSNNNSFAIAGVAGIRNGHIYSSIIQGRDFKQVGCKITKPMVVESCDECFFFVKKENFLGFKNLGKTWHFYSVEYAIRAMLLNERVVLLPLDIYHLSPGWSLDDSYWLTLEKIARIYKNKIRYIPTTFGNYKLNFSIFAFIKLKILKRHIKYFLK